MIESMVRTLPDIEVAIRSDILNSYPNVNIIFTNGKDEDGRIVYIDVVEADDGKYDDMKDVINKIILKYVDDISKMNTTYIPRRIF